MENYDLQRLRRPFYDHRLDGPKARATEPTELDLSGYSKSPEQDPASMEATNYFINKFDILHAGHTIDAMMIPILRFFNNILQANRNYAMKENLQSIHDQIRKLLERLPIYMKEQEALGNQSLTSD